MTINGKIFSQDIIDRINKFVRENPEISRRQLSLQVCQWLDWRGANGKFKEMSCRVALLRLHRQGMITLPAGYAKPPKGKHDTDISEDNYEREQIETSLSEMGSIHIEPIHSDESEKSRLWNQLMDRYHYLGSGPLCGAQIRYLIYSERYGLIGGMSFSASAWRLADRDRWIGWDEEARKKNLDKVACNSRFLIHPAIKVKNLASHVLSLCIKRVSKDWQQRYGTKLLLLESFIQQDRFKGSCYRASNWQHVGMTKGRGRQDWGNRYGVPIKDIYLYELQKDARSILCEGRIKPVSPVRRPLDWAEEEFAQAKLGDKRRVERLMSIARDFYAKPEANIPQACGSRAKTKATYRFFDEVENTMEKILAPHYQSTIDRIKQEKIALAVQDTTYLNYSKHPATENLGPISTKVDGCIGLVVHDTMVFNLEGTPLGLLDVQCWARDAAEFGKKHDRHQLPIEQKESNKWLKSLKAAQQAQRQCRNTVLVSVGDRESDIYEFFQAALTEPEGAKILIRAEQDRLMADGHTHLWDHVRSQPLAGIQQLYIAKRGKRSAREAKLAIRFTKATLKAPKRKPHLKELQVWAIHAEEIECPEGEEPLQWLLLTTIVIDSFEDAAEKLQWYTLRWWIEVYHRTLKSGCKIEQRQLGHADRIESCLAIDMVVAWRIFHLTKLGRQTPDVPCTVFFEEAQWKALVAYKTQNPIPPENPPSLRQAMHMVAGLGGFLGRKGDGEPGTQTLWLGLQRLDDLTEMWKTCMSHFAPNLIRPSPALVPS